MRYRWARVRPRPPRITHPRDKQEEVESAPGPSIWYGPGASPSRTPLAEQGYCRDCDICDERGNAGKRQHVIEEIGLHGILPNRGTREYHKRQLVFWFQGIGLLVIFFSSAVRSKCEKLRILRACRWRSIGLRRDPRNQRVHTLFAAGGVGASFNAR